MNGANTLFSANTESPSISSVGKSKGAAARICVYPRFSLILNQTRSPLFLALQKTTLSALAAKMEDLMKTILLS